MASIIIPENVTAIGSYAFYGCSKLNFVFYPGTNNPSNDTSIFQRTPLNVIYVTEKYENDKFCGLPVALLPTASQSAKPSCTETLIHENTEFLKSSSFDHEFTEQEHSNDIVFTNFDDDKSNSHSSETNSFVNSNDLVFTNIDDYKSHSKIFSDEANNELTVMIPNTQLSTSYTELDPAVVNDDKSKHKNKKGKTKLKTILLIIIFCFEIVAIVLVISLIVVACKNFKYEKVETFAEML